MSVANGQNSPKSRLARNFRKNCWNLLSAERTKYFSSPKVLILLGFTPHDNRGIVSTSVTGALAYLQMGRARKMAGDEAAASKFYEEFLTLWKQADPDIPINRQARTEHVALRKGSTGP